jgi:hypothetical protein
MGNSTQRQKFQKVAPAPIKEAAPLPTVQAVPIKSIAIEPPVPSAPPLRCVIDRFLQKKIQFHLTKGACVCGAKKSMKCNVRCPYLWNTNENAIWVKMDEKDYEIRCDKAKEMFQGANAYFYHHKRACSFQFAICEITIPPEVQANIELGMTYTIDAEFEIAVTQKEGITLYCTSIISWNSEFLSLPEQQPPSYETMTQLNVVSTVTSLNM